MEQANAQATEVTGDWRDQEQCSATRSSLWLLCFLLQAAAPMVALHFCADLLLEDAHERGIVAYQVTHLAT
jgi:hypothetical protein